jgi:hypothetical protein
MTRSMARLILIAALASLIVTLATVAGPAVAQRDRNEVWSVSESVDPITGVRRCVVAAFDRAMNTRYSRTGYLYPFVEANSLTGLLVGVSSGGRFRLPSGDIVWRVDDRPYRELHAADNPLPATPEGESSALQDLTNYQMRAIQAATATATVASGQRAREILDEMLGGSTLVFRGASAAPSYGLPSQQTNEVGQITNEGLRPYALDQSFRDGLTACGILGQAASGEE